MRPTWDQYFLGLARAVSTRSPDNERKVGAVLVREDNSIISTGYNGFLRGAEDCRLASCPTGKHRHVIHAEVNALLTASRHGVSTEGATLYCTRSPCYNCARLLFQAGIRHLIFIEKSEKVMDEWDTWAGGTPNEVAKEDYFVWTW